jgi:hypothetical protein
MKILLATCLAVLTFGCQHTGDFGAFFVQQVSHYGGRTKTTNTIPELRGTWTIKFDDGGFQAHLSGVPFADVQLFMKQVYGDPIIMATNTDDGQRHGVYGARDIGVAIQFFGETNGVGFICVYAQKSQFKSGAHATTNTDSGIRPMGAFLTTEEAIKIAQLAAKLDGRRLSDYEPPKAHYEFARKDKSWSVFFDGRDPAPGNFFSVSIDDQTGKTELSGGL